MKCYISCNIKRHIVFFHWTMHVCCTCSYIITDYISSNYSVWLAWFLPVWCHRCRTDVTNVNWFRLFWICKKRWVQKYIIILVNLHRNRRYFVLKLHTWFCLSHFLKTNIPFYCIYQYFMSINSFFNTVSVSRYSRPIAVTRDPD
jgi:hypothetical protein